MFDTDFDALYYLTLSAIGRNRFREKVDCQDLLT